MIIDNSIFSIDEEKFIIEDVDGENSLTKKFRSKAKDHVRIFKWDFGDNTPILETDNRTVYHTFPRHGTYLVKHQACSFSWCCSKWCTRYVKIEEEKEEHNEREHHMSYSSYLSSPELVIISPEFLVEDIPIYTQLQSLDHQFRKRFTSSASPLATIFKWDFGDGHTLVTHDRSIEHEYHNAGFYIVKHQACFLDAPCCYTNTLPWCEKKIKVLPPEAAAPAWLAFIGVGGFLLLAAKRECEDYNNKKDCEDVRIHFKDRKPYCKIAKGKEKLLKEPCCEWIETEKEKRCVPRCRKGYERKITKGKAYCAKI